MEVALLQHSRPVTCAVYDEFIFTGAKDRTVQVWRPRTFELHCTLPQGSPVTCLALAPRSELLVVGTEGRTILVWDWKRAAVRRELTGHEMPVSAVSVSPAEQFLASISHDLTRVVDLQSGREVLRLPFCTPARAIAWRGDAQLLVCASSGHVNVVDVLTGNNDLLRAVVAGVSHRVDLFPRYVVVCSERQTAIDALGADKSWLRDLDNDNAVQVLSFSPNGKTLLLVSHKQCAVFRRDALCAVQRFVLPARANSAVCLNVDGTRCVIAGDDWTARVFDLYSSEREALVQLACAVASGRRSCAALGRLPMDMLALVRMWLF
jgi:WD40 repeat protein